MGFKKFGNFNWIEMDSKNQNLDLTRTKQIHFFVHLNPLSFVELRGDTPPFYVERFF